MDVEVTGGVRLHVNLSRGNGVPFLLVHGLASNARMWDGVAALLSAAGHAAAAVDQRGHGLSDKPDHGYDFEAVTGDLAALIAALELDRPVAVGQSWGGNVVLELAGRHPDLVRGVACVDGGTIELAERFPDWESCAAVLAPPRSEGMPYERIETMIRSMHPTWPETGIQGTLANFEVREDGTVAPRLSFERHMLILRAMYEHRPSRVYPEVKAPVLLLPADTGDALWTEGKRKSVQRAEAALAKARTHWFSSDHDVHAQRPDELTDVLLACVEDGFFA